MQRSWCGKLPWKVFLFVVIWNKIFVLSMFTPGTSGKISWIASSWAWCCHSIILVFIWPVSVVGLSSKAIKSSTVTPSSSRPHLLFKNVVNVWFFKSTLLEALEHGICRYISSNNLKPINCFYNVDIFYYFCWGILTTYFISSFWKLH